MPIILDPTLDGSADPDVVSAMQDLVAQINAALATQSLPAEQEALEGAVLTANAAHAAKRETMTTTEATAFYEAFYGFLVGYPDGSRLSGV